MNTSFSRGPAMERCIDDELKAIFELGGGNNVFVIPDDDDGLTGELASLDSTSNVLQQELTMSDLRFEDYHASNISKASTMDHPAALIEEEDGSWSPWKPTLSMGQDNCVAFETPSARNFFAETTRVIQNVEDGLTAQGMERSAARQVAISLKNSQALIESQRQLETQKMMMECRQRQLDREWSQRQHEERLRAEAFQRNVDRMLAQQRHEESKQASRFDPNWQEKLEKKRGKCLSAMTNVGWEAFLVHYGSMIIVKPMVESFYSQSYYLPFQEFGRLASNLICDCESSTDSYLLSYLGNILWATSGIFSFSGLLQTDYIGLDSGLCYFSCLAWVLLKMGVALLAHQFLRMFSMPIWMHNMVNLLALPFVLGASFNTLLSQRFSMEALLSFTWIHFLVIWVLAGHGLAHRKHSVCKARVQEASKSPMDFPEVFEKSMQQLDNLHAQLWLGHGAVVVLFCFNFCQFVRNAN